jgi:hypothetical protein
MPVVRNLRRLAAFSLASILLSAATPLTLYNVDDTNIATRTFRAAQDRSWSKLPMGELVAMVGRYYLGVPYKAKSLERPGDECLIVDLTGLDCTTFVETSLAMARAVRLGQPHFEGFTQALRTIRYRDGKVAGYPSRLHYFSDWLWDNSRKGLVEEITESLGGEHQPLTVDFMTRHPQSYMQLRDQTNVTAMRAIEATISARTHFMLPKDKLAEVESHLQTGDIIALVPAIPGLDVAHVGLAVRENDGRIHFLNAPMSGRKVEVSRETLVDLLKDRRTYVGIRVARPLEPHLPAPQVSATARTHILPG